MSSSEDSDTELPPPAPAATGSGNDHNSGSDAENNSAGSGAEVEEAENLTFADLGLVDVLVENCDKLGWKKPSRIQAEAIPVALEGKDVIGLAETGSGKTAAFALPILQVIWGGWDLIPMVLD